MELQEFIKKGFIQNPYQEFTLTVPAGTTSRPVAFNYNYFALLEATAGGIQVKFGNSGNFSDLIGAGLGVQLPVVVENVQFTNPTGGDITITFSLAIGEVFDRRLSVTGNIAVVNGTLPFVVDENTQLQALLQNHNDLASPLTTIEGATNVRVTGTASATLVTAGANTNGIIIRTLYGQVSTRSNTGSAVLTVTAGTRDIIHMTSGNQCHESMFAKDIEIEAGVALSYNMTDALSGSVLCMNYEVK